MTVKPGKLYVNDDGDILTVREPDEADRIVVDVEGQFKTFADEQEFKEYVESNEFHETPHSVDLEKLNNQEDDMEDMSEPDLDIEDDDDMALANLDKVVGEEAARALKEYLRDVYDIKSGQDKLIQQMDDEWEKGRKVSRDSEDKWSKITDGESLKATMKELEGLFESREEDSIEESASSPKGVDDLVGTKTAFKIGSSTEKSLDPLSKSDVTEKMSKMIKHNLFDNDFYFNYTDNEDEYEAAFSKLVLDPMIKDADKTLKDFFVLEGDTLKFKITGDKAQSWIDDWFKKSSISDDLRQDYYEHRKEYAGVILESSEHDAIKALGGNVAGMLKKAGLDGAPAEKAIDNHTKDILDAGGVNGKEDWMITLAKELGTETKELVDIINLEYEELEYEEEEPAEESKLQKFKDLYTKMIDMGSTGNDKIDSAVNKLKKALSDELNQMTSEGTEIDDIYASLKEDGYIK